MLFLLLATGIFAQEPADSLQAPIPAFQAQPDTLRPYKDTVFLNESDFESIVTYAARDSIYSDLRKNQVPLYGNAHLNYQGIDMTAEYLLIDLDSNQIFATYVLDSLGRRVGSPVFVDGGDTLRAASLKYNFDTKKAYIKEVGIKQDEIYLTMELAKRQANEEIHFVRGKFTTCNLEEPHYHFFLSRAVMVPDKRIVTGPMNLWIMGVPTPLGLPFSVIPQRKDREKKSGFIMPQISAISQYGFGVQDLGYYFPINDRVQTTVYGMLYSRGSFGLRDVTEYAVKYRFTGNFEAGYQFFHPGFPDPNNEKIIEVNWQHNKDPKSNPNWTFTSNINFRSNGTNKQTLNANIPSSQYLNNTLNSDISLGRRFGSSPLSMSLKASLRQNSSNNRVDLTSPIYNLNVTRFYPFKRRKSTDGKIRFYETIGMTYNFEGKNVATFGDSLISNGDFERIGQSFMNGLTQRADMTTTINAFNSLLRITPTVTYSQKYNFQSIERGFQGDTLLVTDTLNRAMFSQGLSASLNLTTNVYSYYRFIGKRQTLLRHVATPGVSFTYVPSIQGAIAEYQDTTGKTIQYSQLERSIYSETFSKSSGTIGLSLNNTFELKRRSDKDTVTGFMKTRIIDNLIMNTGYDIFRDSMNWNDLSINILMNPTDAININITGNHSWYAWDRNTGARLSQYAHQNGQGIGRLTQASITTTWTLTTKKSREIMQTQQAVMSTTWNPQYQQWIISPYQLVSFEIPWKVSLTHTLSYSLNNFDSTSYQQRHYIPRNSFTLTGDVSITENWKMGVTTNFDADAGKIANTQITMFRNIHCWNLSFNWVPIGTNKSFTVSIRGNGSMLSNAKLNLRKPPALFQ